MSMDPAAASVSTGRNIGGNGFGGHRGRNRSLIRCARKRREPYKSRPDPVLQTRGLMPLRCTGEGSAATAVP